MAAEQVASASTHISEGSQVLSQKASEKAVIYSVKVGVKRFGKSSRKAAASLNKNGRCTGPAKAVSMPF